MMEDNVPASTCHPNPGARRIQDTAVLNTLYTSALVLWESMNGIKFKALKTGCYRQWLFVEKCTLAIELAKKLLQFN